MLDSFALPAYFQAEPAALKVKGILRQARDQEVTVVLSLINLGEILYTVERRLGAGCSREILHDVLALPIRVAEVTSDQVFYAAHIKAKFPVSYADAFAAGLAREMGATVITGDPEFERVQALVDILRL